MPEQAPAANPALQNNPIPTLIISLDPETGKVNVQGNITQMTIAIGMCHTAAMKLWDFTKALPQNTSPQIAAASAQDLQEIDRRTKGGHTF